MDFRCYFHIECLIQKLHLHTRWHKMFKKMVKLDRWMKLIKVVYNIPRFVRLSWFVTHKIFLILNLKTGILEFSQIFCQNCCWMRPPFFFHCSRNLLFPLMSHCMLGYGMRGHTFSVLRCSNSKDWNNSLIFLTLFKFIPNMILQLI